MKTINLEFVNTGVAVPDAMCIEWASGMLSQADNYGTNILISTECMLYAFRVLQRRNGDFSVNKVTWPCGTEGDWDDINQSIEPWPNTTYIELLDEMCFGGNQVDF